MCDTVVALSDSTKMGVAVFGKNSDREPNEVQLVELVPRLEHDEDYVQCTYVKVPQAKATYSVLLSRPYWMWGAEMGVNEFGVAIGNEAVFTKLPRERKGLLGMDMLRLALERSKTAEEALHCIIKLLEEYGQGGNCSATGKMYYHNSFIIADPREAWVLETAGRFWVAEKVKGVRSISNALSIEGKGELASKGVVEYAIERGWCKDDSDFNFARCYSDRFYTGVAKGRYRRRFTQEMLEKSRGSVGFNTVAEILRSHSFQEGYAPAKGSMKDICMHAGGITRPSQTAGSLIAVLYDKCPIVWVTGTSSPCISIYKPFFIEGAAPEAGGVYVEADYWWRHEKLHRLLLCSYPKYAPLISAEVKEVENSLIKKAVELRERYLNGEVDYAQLVALTKQGLELGKSLDEKWLSQVKPGRCWNPMFRIYWNKVNKSSPLR